MAGTNLGLEFKPHSVLVVRLDDDMVLVQILDDEALLLVQGQQDLLDRGVTVSSI